MEFSRLAVQKAKDSSSPVRVYADGVFDLCHLGHMKMLEQAKTILGAHRTHLIVGVCADKDVHKHKGLTLMDQKTRMETVSYIRGVDEVILAPWTLTPEFLQKHRIDFVAHDALPYKSEETLDLYDFVKKQGQFLETKRTPSISTSDIILKLLRNYDGYVQRNLDRGFSKEELNLGEAWAVELKAKERKKKVIDALAETKHHVRILQDRYRAGTQTRICFHLTRAFLSQWRALKYLVAFLNPFGYLTQMRALLLLSGLVFWNFLVFHLGRWST